MEQENDATRKTALRKLADRLGGPLGNNSQLHGTLRLFARGQSDLLEVVSGFESQWRTQLKREGDNQKGPYQWPQFSVDIRLLVISCIANGMLLAGRQGLPEIEAHITTCKKCKDIGRPSCPVFRLIIKQTFSEGEETWRINRDR